MNVWLRYSWDQECARLLRLWLNESWLLLHRRLARRVPCARVATRIEVWPTEDAIDARRWLWRLNAHARVRRLPLLRLSLEERLLLRRLKLLLACRMHVRRCVGWVCSRGVERT